MSISLLLYWFVSFFLVATFKPYSISLLASQYNLLIFFEQWQDYYIISVDHWIRLMAQCSFIQEWDLAFYIIVPPSSHVLCSDRICLLPFFSVYTFSLPKSSEYHAIIDISKRFSPLGRIRRLFLNFGFGWQDIHIGLLYWSCILLFFLVCLPSHILVFEHLMGHMEPNIFFLILRHFHFLHVIYSFTF